MALQQMKHKLNELRDRQARREDTRCVSETWVTNTAVRCSKEDPRAARDCVGLRTTVLWLYGTSKPWLTAEQ